jgi:hypothetical protein
MACDCKDENGEYLGACLGTCHPIVQNLSDERIIDLFNQMKILINEYNEKQYVRYIDNFHKLSHRLDAVAEKSIDCRYKEGFADGFKLALNMNKAKTDE